MATALVYSDMSDYRIDPFTNVCSPVEINCEVRVIPASPPYYIQLWESPSPNCALTIGGYTETTACAAPATGQFRVKYGGDRQGLLEFNAAQAGCTVCVCYYGLGTTASKETLDIFVRKNDVSTITCLKCFTNGICASRTGFFAIYATANYCAGFFSASCDCGIYSCAAKNIGVYGRATCYGGFFSASCDCGIYSRAAKNIGVYGIANCCYGGYFLASCDYGIYAYAARNCGIVGLAKNYGIYGCATESVGVYGIANCCAGVLGSACNYGVAGSASGNYGVCGCATCYGGYFLANCQYGIYACACCGYAGYFKTDVDTGIYSEAARCYAGCFVAYCKYGISVAALEGNVAYFETAQGMGVESNVGLCYAGHFTANCQYAVYARAACSYAVYACTAATGYAFYGDQGLFYNNGNATIETASNPQITLNDSTAGTSGTVQYNSATESIDFIFS